MGVGAPWLGVWGVQGTMGRGVELLWLGGQWGKGRAEYHV